MSINLSNIFSRDENIYYFEEKIDDSDINLDLKEFEILHPIEYKGQIAKINMEYVINMDIYYTFKTRCDRCLISIQKDIKTSTSAILEDSRYEKQENEDNEIENVTQEDNVIYYENNILDIEQYVLMEILSSLPMKTLCDEECKGLCSQCGQDLNKETCDCVIENIDPRLEKLKDFFDNE